MSESETDYDTITRDVRLVLRTIVEFKSHCHLAEMEKFMNGPMVALFDALKDTPSVQGELENINNERRSYRKFASIMQKNIDVMLKNLHVIYNKLKTEVMPAAHIDFNNIFPVANKDRGAKLSNSKCDLLDDSHRNNYLMNMVVVSKSSTTLELNRRKVYYGEVKSILNKIKALQAIDYPKVIVDEMK